SIRHALGQAYEELGRYPKAEQHAARTVELRLKNLGPEHVDTIAAQNALGWALFRQSANSRTEQESRDKLEKIRALLTPVLETARKRLGPEHEETLRSMHVLAAVMDKPEQARALNEELLAILKRVLGPEHPKTLSTIHNLALNWQELGNLEKAKQLDEQI